jgi:hypothetical protein
MIALVGLRVEPVVPGAFELGLLRQSGTKLVARSRFQPRFSLVAAYSEARSISPEPLGV